MLKIVAKSGCLNSNFIIEISSNLQALNAKSTKIKMVRIIDEELADISDFFVFEMNKDGEWIMQVDRCYVCSKSRISSLYISLLVLFPQINLNDFINAFVKKLK